MKDMAFSAMILLPIFLVILPIDAAGPPWPTGKIPNTLTGKSVDALARAGVWYNYRFFGEHPPRVNDKLVSTPIGEATVPGTSRKALLTNVVISWWTAGPNPQCIGQFAQTYVTADGREVMVVYNTDPPNTPISLTSYAMYDDAIVQLRYFCAKPNKKTNMCEEPHFFMNTRIRPDQMSAQQKADVDATINRVLLPYELSINDFLLETWIDAPDCNAQLPVCYAGLIDGLTQQFGGQLPTSKVRFGYRP